MTSACAPSAHGAEGLSEALAAAMELLRRGIDQLRAAMEVEWEAPAAQLYRAEVAEALHAVARDLSSLHEALRRAHVLSAAGGPG
jgi:hypothetical protein